MMSQRLVWISPVLACLLLLAGYSAVHAAAPRIILVYGSTLQNPVVLDDWSDNGAVEGVATSDITFGDLSGRPYLDLAFFWGNEWVQYVDSGQPVDNLNPDQGNQHGRFYPAIGEAPAVVALHPVFGSAGAPPTEQIAQWLIRRVDPPGLAILAQYGIPTRVTDGTPAALPTTGTGGSTSRGMPASRKLVAIAMACIALAIPLQRLSNKHE